MLNIMVPFRSFILCSVFVIWTVHNLPLRREEQKLHNLPLRREDQKLQKTLPTKLVNRSSKTLRIPPISDERNFSAETSPNRFKIKRDTSCEVGESICLHRNERTGSYDCFRQCQRCDGIVDCPRATDEEECPCRAKIASKFICDGTPDCFDYSDELGCGECLNDELACDIECVSVSEFCAGRSRCSKFSRVLFCARLSQNPFYASDETSYRSKGYLQMRVRKKWLPVCGTPETNIEKAINEYCSEVTGVRTRRPVYKLKELSAKSSWLKLQDEKDYFFATRANTCSQNIGIFVECVEPGCQDERESQKRHAPFKIVERIVGGSDAREEDWRFLVRIIKNGEHHCGGSLLTPKWVLSASHCFLKISGEMYEVETGSGRTGTYGPSVQKRLVSHVIRHPEFDPYTIAHDVALLRLLTPLHLNRWSRPACFMDSGIQLLNKTTCFLAGWGYQTENGNLAAVLQEISIPILEGEDCIQEFYFVDPQKVICAGHKKGQKDSCQGDSGGPMMCNICKSGENNSQCEGVTWVQAALVSYGRGCARPGIPGVYTKVEYFKKWISDTIADIENSNELPEIVPKTICDGLLCIHSGGLCLNSSRICDKKVDCLNAEDEINCYDRETTSNTFEISKVESYSDYDNEEDENVEPLNETSSCPENHYRCEIIPGCIPNTLLCDEVRNCRDGTDEIRCTCVDRIYLKNGNKICDGFYDCADFTDEFCELCKDGKWLCKRSAQCITPDKICDAIPDCRYGEDELNCLALAPKGGELFLDKEGNPFLSDSGFLLLYSSSSSTWDPVCEHEMDHQVALDICSYLGFGPPLSIKYNANLPSTYKIRQDSRRQRRSVSFPNPKHDFRSTTRGLTVDGVRVEENFKDESFREPKFSGAGFEPVSPHRKMIGNSGAGRRRRMACNQVELACGERICGKVAALHFSNAPPLADASHVPWAVNIFSSGEYLCGGTIIDLQWVISSAECLKNISLLTHEIHVLGGSNRGYSESRYMSPFEVDIRIDALVEIDELGLILLHMEKSISLLEQLNSVCFDPRPNVIWKECLMVGPYKDDLSHAFILVPNEEECQEDKICLESFSPLDDICTKHWYGLISCREERKSSSLWKAVAISDFRKEFNCSKFPKSFTKISEDFIQKIIRKMGEHFQIQPTLPCNTHRCPLGACLTSEKICDAKMSCPDMSDEPYECPVPVKLCSYINSTICECPPDYFKCLDGICLPSYKICDGVPHCVSGEDELNCSCSVIITSPREKKNCNGIIDCSDESDEMHCNCDMETEFRCFRSQGYSCISRSLVCDAVPDCSEGEDEAFCLTVSSTLFPEENALGIPSSTNKGYLLLRVKGKWYTYASDDWAASNSEAVCLSLGYKGVFETLRKIINQSLFKSKANEVLPVIGEIKEKSFVVFMECFV